jgi:pimeloyl-ACP methyl ester carboxylesterase
MRTHMVETRDGLRLGVLETGALDGKPVVVHNGTPSSKLPYPRWVEDGEDRGIRHVWYDRPGYADSTARFGRSVADAAQDVADIVDALGVERFGVMGISGGGPHTLACAALLPERVTGAAVLASAAPYPADGLDWLAGMGDDNVAEFEAALNGKDALEGFLTEQVEQVSGTGPHDIAEHLRSLLGPADSAALTGEIAEHFHASFLDAVSAGIDGWRDDDLAFTRHWGFELGDIDVPVLLWHGVDDKFVPVSHGKWLADHIPGVTSHISDTDGHITIAINRIGEVHSWLCRSE